jgi:hypothetical protein
MAPVSSPLSPYASEQDDALDPQEALDLEDIEADTEEAMGVTESTENPSRLSDEDDIDVLLDELEVQPKKAKIEAKKETTPEEDALAELLNEVAVPTEEESDEKSDKDESLVPKKQMVSQELIDRPLSMEDLFDDNSI